MKKKLPMIAVGVLGLCIGLPNSGLGAHKASKDNPSAYVALRTIKQEYGPNALKQIIEVTGREGVPQPYIWRVIQLDKGSLNEIDIADGKIVGQRKLNRSSRALVGVPLNFQSLNLDSSGAFQLADTQARKMNLSFNALHYTLRADPTGKPIWTLQILDGDRNDVGSISIAATDASIINATGQMAVTNHSKTQIGQHAAASSQSARHKKSARAEVSGFFKRSGRTLSKAGNNVKSSFEHTSKRVSNWFTRLREKN